MELREIYRLAETADDGLPALEQHADFYAKALEDYSHTEEHSALWEQGRPVSREMVRDIALKTAEMVPEYQSIVKNLEAAAEEVLEHSSFRYIDGERVRAEDLADQIETLVDGYREALEKVWNTSYRMKQHPDFEVNPIDVRTRRWRRGFEDVQPVGDTGEFAEETAQPEVVAEFFT
ncbi:MAG: hypothetical protein ABEI58_02890 [Candidatus Nanohaloarchaea archaeon]